MYRSLKIQNLWGSKGFNEGVEEIGGFRFGDPKGPRMREKYTKTKKKVSVCEERQGIVLRKGFRLGGV